MGCDPNSPLDQGYPKNGTNPNILKQGYSQGNLFAPPSNGTLFDAWLPANMGLTTAIKVETDLDYVWTVPCKVIPEDTIASTQSSSPPTRCGHFPSHDVIGAPVLISPAGEDPHITKITWQKQVGANRYILYGSPNPMFKNKLKEISFTQNTAIFNPPIILPEDIVYYFWVAYINPKGEEVFIQSEPVHLYNNSAFDPNVSPISEEIQNDIATDADMPYYFEEMRRRHMFELQNDGEDYFLYIRRMHGQPCVEVRTTDGKRITPMTTPFYGDLGTDFDPVKTPEDEAVEAKDPEYQHSGRCKNCFGTGIAGGYYPRLRIKIRYGDLPRRVIDMKEQGLSFRHDFDSWTLWHPRLKERDLLVRIKDGERFTIKGVGQSEMRSPALHQEFSTVSLPRSAIEYELTDDHIIEALKRESAWDVGKFDWAVWM